MFTVHDFERILICASEADISDIYMTANEPISWRRYGSICKLNQYIPSSSDMWTLFCNIADEETQEDYVDCQDVSFNYILDDWSFKVCAYRCSGKINMSFKVLPTLSRLKPFTDLVADIDLPSKGLIVIAGRKGAGTTTTISNLIRRIGIDDKMITILEETPEVFTEKNRGIYRKRSISDFYSWETAIKSVIDSSSDVVCLTHYESWMFDSIIELAQDKLVVLDLKSKSVYDVLTKLTNNDQSKQYILSVVLSSIIVQKLVPNKKKGGMIALTEYAINTPNFQSILCRFSFDGVIRIMELDKRMRTFDQSKEQLNIE